MFKVHDIGIGSDFMSMTLKSWVTHAVISSVDHNRQHRNTKDHKRLLSATICQ